MKKLNRKGVIPHIEFILALVVIVAVGFGVLRVINSDDDSLSSESSQEAEDTSDVVEAFPDDLTGLKTIEEISTLATDGSEVTIAGIELEFEDGKLVYVVHLSDGSVLAFDAFDGSVITLSDDDDDEFKDDDVIPANFNPSITLAEALAIAQGERPGIAIEKVELEVEDGEIVYSVRFVDDGRVDVNSENGTIVDLRGADGVRDPNFDDEDDDLDEDGIDNDEDDDDDNDGIDDDEDDDDDNDGIDDDEDDDDDNDGEDDDDEDNSGSGSN